MFSELREAIRAVQQVDLTALTDGELREAVATLHECETMLAAAATRLVGAADGRNAWAADGARNGQAWLRWKCRLAPTTAAARLRVARAVRHLPEVEAAWCEARIGTAQVGLFAKARTPATEAVMGRDEKVLVAHAARLHFAAFAKLMAYWTQRADPDGVERDAQAQRDRRKLHLSQSYEGMWFGDVVLDPIGGTVVSNALKRIAEELFEADWADARHRLGHDPTVADLARTPAQRRADALVEMATRATTAPPDGRRPAPLLTVLVDYETLAGRVCELANGTVVTPGSLLPLLDHAHLERVVFDGPSRVIDVGAHRRLFTGATRRAVEVRDRECFHPTCDVTADDTQAQIDHVEPYEYGGLTVQANGRLACGYHNRLRNRTSVQLE